MRKPFKDGTDSIGRGLVSKNIEDGLQLVARSRDILTWEVTNIKCLNIFFKIIPHLLVLNHQMFDDEAEHGDGTTMICRKTLAIRFDFRMKSHFHREEESFFKPVVTLDFNSHAMAQDEFLPAEY
jgi:hypothetical protein